MFHYLFEKDGFYTVDPVIKMIYNNRRDTHLCDYFLIQFVSIV